MTTSQDIVRDIEATRADIRLALGELERRLSVDAMVHRMIGPAKSGTIETGRALGAAVRENPLALAVTAVGLAWLMLGRRAPNGNHHLVSREGMESGVRLDPNRVRGEGDADLGFGAGSSVGRIRSDDVDPDASTATREGAASGGAGSRVRGATQEAVEGSRRAVGKASETIQRSTGAALRKTRETAATVGDRVQGGMGMTGQFVREHPLSVGAAVLFAGAALAIIVIAGRSETWATDGDREDAEGAASGDASAPYPLGEGSEGTNSPHFEQMTAGASGEWPGGPVDISTPPASQEPSVAVTRNDGGVAESEDPITGEPVPATRDPASTQLPEKEALAFAAEPATRVSSPGKGRH
jgi:hypothetical protein